MEGSEIGEDWELGGDLPVKTGDLWNNRYEVIEKLGWGAFSTVWKCKDLRLRGGHQEVAVKVAKRNRSATEQARDEVELLKCIGRGDDGIGSEFVVKMMEHFEVEGPHGVHICISLELLGPSILSCLPEEGMCLENVKVVMKQVLEGLHFLHNRAQIIHTDIKPENILTVGCSPEDDFKERVPRLRVKVADLGSSCWVDKKFSVKIGTQEYRAPEVLLQADYGTSADIWSSACVAFELATGDYLFMPKDASDPEEVFTKEEDHLALITELLGPLPSDLLLRGGHWRKYYKSTTKTDGFRHIPAAEIDYKSLDEILMKNYKWESSAADEFSSWLLPMLALFPEDRVTALTSSLHPFIQVVQENSSRQRRKYVRVRSETADVKMKCLASKLKGKGQKKSGQVSLPKSKVTKLRDREEELGSKLLRSGTPMTRRLRAPLERPKERKQQAEMRHQTAAYLPPLDILIPSVVANAGKGGMCSGKALVRYVGEQHPGYGIGAGKQWKLRAAVNYSLAAGKIIQVSGRGLNGTFSLPRQNGAAERRRKQD